MADGRHLEKSKNGYISATVWPIHTKLDMVTHVGPPNWTVSWNLERIKNQYNWRPPSWKKLKNGYISATVWPIDTKFDTQWRRVAKMLIDEGCTSLPLVNSGVTGPKYTKPLNNVARSSQMKRLKSELRYYTQFRNTKATKKIKKWVRPISPILTIKLVVMATFLERSEREGQISNRR